MAGGIIEGQWHTRLSSARYAQEDIREGVILWHLMLTTLLLDLPSESVGENFAHFVRLMSLSSECGAP